MSILDCQSKLNRYNRGGILSSIESLARQTRDAWQIAKRLNFPVIKADKIFICAMGGSALAGQLLKAVFSRELKPTLEIVSDYELPKNADKNSLCLAMSYGGNTEETLSVVSQAKKRGLRVVGIASGGKLGEMIKSSRIEGVVFEPRANPSGQPRQGLGYLMILALGILVKLKYVKITDAEISGAVKAMSEAQKRFGVNCPTRRNMAKQLALKMKGRVAVVIGAEFLAANAHVFANQLNENAKTFADYFLLPELNHHLLEGFGFPRGNRRRLLLVFLNSPFYREEIRQRLYLTQKVALAQKIPFINCGLSAASPFNQMWEALALSSFVSFYLAVLNGVEPARVKWVDYFKAELKKIQK